MRPFLFLLVALLPTTVAQADIPAKAEPAGLYQGQLLVSTERNLDPRFHRSVIYMVRHTAKSSFGIVINKPYGRGPLAKMMKGLGLDPEGATGDLQLHYGGPVAVNHVFFLHSSDYAHERSRDIDGTVSFTKDINILAAMAGGKGPNHLFAAAGYAGWSAQQLEKEIERGFWTLAQPDEERVFGDDKSGLWERVSGDSDVPL